VIRSFLSGIVSPECITHAYIPDILGKEKRKDEASKEGKLGVEGVSNEIILDALKKAGIIGEAESQTEKRLVTKTDLYEDGICGKSNSLEKRRKLLKILNLPERTSANSMLKIINTFLSYDDYKQAVKDIEN
jgi:ribonuclease M5